MSRPNRLDAAFRVAIETQSSVPLSCRQCHDPIPKVRTPYSFAEPLPKSLGEAARRIEAEAGTSVHAIWRRLPKDRSQPVQDVLYWEGVRYVDAYFCSSLCAALHGRFHAAREVQASAAKSGRKTARRTRASQELPLCS